MVGVFLPHSCSHPLATAGGRTIRAAHRNSMPSVRSLNSSDGGSGVFFQVVDQNVSPLPSLFHPPKSQRRELERVRSESPMCPPVASSTDSLPSAPERPAGPGRGPDVRQTCSRLHLKRQVIERILGQNIYSWWNNSCTTWTHARGSVLFCGVPALPPKANNCTCVIVITITQEIYLPERNED